MAILVESQGALDRVMGLHLPDSFEKWECPRRTFPPDRCPPLEGHLELPYVVGYTWMEWQRVPPHPPGIWSDSFSPFAWTKPRDGIRSPFEPHHSLHATHVVFVRPEVGPFPPVQLSLSIRVRLLRSVQHAPVHRNSGRDVSVGFPQSAPDTWAHRATCGMHMRVYGAKQTTGCIGSPHPSIHGSTIHPIHLRRAPVGRNAHVGTAITGERESEREETKQANRGGTDRLGRTPNRGRQNATKVDQQRHQPQGEGWNSDCKPSGGALPGGKQCCDRNGQTTTTHCRTKSVVKKRKAPVH